MAKRTNIIAERSKAGKEGAAKRYGKPIANASANSQQSDAPSTLTSTSEEGSVAIATDAGASPDGSVMDLKRELWKRAKALLGKHGITEKQAGSLIGKWLKSLGPPDSETRLLHILASAEAHCQGDIVEYVTAAIGRGVGTRKTPAQERADGLKPEIGRAHV